MKIKCLKKFQSINHGKNHVIKQASFISTLTRIFELYSTPKKRILEFRTTHNLLKILNKLLIFNIFYQINRSLLRIIF